MRDILPSHLVDFIRDRYIAGVADAEAFFDQNKADEDSLTGALGQAIAMKDPLHFSGPAGSYSVQVTYQKLRGRGLNAPERLYGADGIFQIAVTEGTGRILRMKGLPFQSKTEWRGRNAAVAKQSGDIQSSIGGGIVIDYSKNGYKSCSTSVAIETHGNRAELNRRKAMKPLGQVLGVDFLECRIGQHDLFFDSDQERFMDGLDIIQPKHAISTVVRKMQNAP